MQKEKGNETMNETEKSQAPGGAATRVAECAGHPDREFGFPAITAVKSPNGLLRHACIGTGNMAWSDISSFRTHPKIEMAAFCDVDSDFLDKARAEFPKAHFYRDWREMFAAEGDAIDSVNISIPDHNHVVAGAEAFNRRKHVYMQKPLCKTMVECEYMRRRAREAGVVTQLGTQYFAYGSDRHTIGLIKAGVLGPVEEVCFFSTRKGISRRKRHLPQAVPPPETLDWDLWLGTAAARDYAPDVYHPLIWRIWHDFGSGWIGDIGCHLMSAVWAGMELGTAAPLDVIAETGTQAESDAVAAITWPTMTRIEWRFGGVPASGGKPFVFKWFDGCSEPDNLAPAKFRPPDEVEALFTQSPFGKRPLEGKAVKCRDGWILQPHSAAKAHAVRNDGKPVPDMPLPEVPSHYHEFVNACLEGRPASSDFAWSTYMMDTVIAGEIAGRMPDTLLKWNPGTRTFGNPEADALLAPHYREGWKIDFS